MVDITPSQIHILSKRALQFVDSPLYIRLDQSLPFWKFSLQRDSENNFQSDKILTLSYRSGARSPIDVVLAEALVRIILDKPVLFLEKLSFREIENYLRDENHLPVFESSVLPEVQLLFLSLKNSLLAALLNNALNSDVRSLKASFSWGNLSLVEKNIQIKDLFIHLNSLYPHLKGLELALAETDQIFVVTNDFPLGLEVLENLLHELFLISDEKFPLKVVAVQ